MPRCSFVALAGLAFLEVFFGFAAFARIAAFAALAAFSVRRAFADSGAASALAAAPDPPAPPRPEPPGPERHQPPRLAHAPRRWTQDDFGGRERCDCRGPRLPRIGSKRLTTPPRDQPRTQSVGGKAMLGFSSQLVDLCFPLRQIPINSVPLGQNVGESRVDRGEIHGREALGDLLRRRTAVERDDDRLE